jgi:hypothetical protein
MKTRRFLLIAVCMAGCSAGRADISPFSAVPVPAMPNNGLIPPGMTTVTDGLPASGYLPSLQARLAGEPVIAVDASARGGPEPPPFRQDEKLLSRLQTLGEAFSSETAPLIPYAVRGAWVLAPEQRDEIVTDLTGLSPLDVTGREGLWKEAITALTPSQVSEMGGADGIAFAALPAEAKERVRRALQPPLVVQPSALDDDETAKPPPAAAPDERSLRIKVRLRLDPPSVLFQIKNGDSTYAQEGSVSGLSPRPPAFSLAPGPQDQDFYGSVHLPAIRRVPNVFKPSDLDGARYRQPIGVDGILPLPAVLESAGKAAGLQLVPSAQYRAVRVFVGSDKIPAGDVLDGIRLALTASWRKVGGFYFLTWDRAGLGTLQERLWENGGALSHQAEVQANDASSDPAWTEIVERAPFAEDDPFGLTPAQRDAVFGPNAERDKIGQLPRVRWQDMTATQRAAARAALSGKQVSAPKPDSSDWEQRSITEQDIQNAALSGRMRVEFSVLLPGAGWVGVPEAWNMHLDPDTVYYWRRRPAKSAAGATPPARPAPAFRPVQRNQPTLSPAGARAVIAPALEAAALDPLAALMHARGFNTLFYPILTDGRVTIPSKAFPPHPGLAKGGGFAAVARVMHAHGVSGVGYMETLTWRRQGEAGHWLQKYPGWLERDILGRAFSDAVSAQSAAQPGRPPQRAAGDLVRPSEPAVSARLETLVREAAGMPGASGLLFVNWSAESSVPTADARTMQLYWQSLTCFAPADRLAGIERDGADPVDVPLNYVRSAYPTDALAFPPSNPPPRPRVVNGVVVPPPPAPPGADHVLLNRLAAITPSPPRAWVTYAVKPANAFSAYGGYRAYGAPEPALPVNVTLSAAEPQFRQQSSPANVIYRVMARSDESTTWNGDRSATAIAQSEGFPAFNFNNAAPALAVYDFRAAPGELMDSLQRVGLPPDPAPKAPSPPAAARAGSCR